MNAVRFHYFFAPLWGITALFGLAGCCPESNGPPASADAAVAAVHGETAKEKASKTAKKSVDGETAPREKGTPSAAVEAKRGTDGANRSETTSGAESEATSDAVTKTLAEWGAAGAKIVENKDGTIKSIDLSAVMEPVAFDPSEKDRLKTLRVLRGRGIFSDKLAEQCGASPDLTEWLWLETTASEKGLESLASLKKLKKARLTGLTATSRTTEILASFPALTELDLSASSLRDVDLAPLAKMKNLTRLNLYQTAVGDAGVEALLPIAKNLLWLNLDATEVTDVVGPTLENFENLAFLHLGRTKVTDALVDSLARLTKLETIHVTRTAVTEEGANRLRESLPNADVISAVEEK